jgi:hypothetical protein
LMRYSIDYSTTASPFESRARHYAPQTRHPLPEPTPINHLAELVQPNNR